MAGITVVNSAAWLIALMVGALVGYAYMRHLGVTADKTTKNIHVPGSWFTMILVLIIFATKYYFGYALGANPGEETSARIK